MVTAIVVNKYRELCLVATLGDDKDFWFKLWMANTLDVSRVGDLHNWSSTLSGSNGVRCDSIAPSVAASSS